MSTNNTTNASAIALATTLITKAFVSHKRDATSDEVIEFMGRVCDILETQKGNLFNNTHLRQSDGNSNIHVELSPLPFPNQPENTQKWVPVMNPRQSISEDGSIIYCLVDGAPLKMLKRYIKRWGFTPDSYRMAFNLPNDYPMTAPAYSMLKKQEAIKVGLGTHENRIGGQKMATDYEMV